MNADIHALSGAYAVDALDDVERAEFERHLQQCPECQDEVASLRAAAVELTHASALTPPPALRDSVLRQVSTAATHASPDRRHRPVPCPSGRGDGHPARVSAPPGQPHDAGSWRLRPRPCSPSAA